MRRIIHITAAVAGALAVLLPGGCQKMSVKSCDYTITPLCQMTEGGDTIQASDLVAYAFFVNAREWEVASREDAARGVITNIEDGTTLPADMTTEQDARSLLKFEAIEGDRTIFFIVFDRTNDIYAWREDGRVMENLEQVNIPVLFRPWRLAAEEGASYSELRWNMVNQVAPEEPAP